MNSVFLDTVGLIGVWNSDDQWHEPASREFERLLANGRTLVSTSYVLAEAGNTAARTSFRSDVDELRASLEAGGRLLFPTSEDWSVAWSAYRRGEVGGAGIVDQLSFAAMRRLGIESAFTNDRHFAAAGFRTLF